MPAESEGASAEGGGENATGKETSAAPPVAISTGVAIVVVDDGAKSGTSVAERRRLGAVVSSRED